MAEVTTTVAPYTVTVVNARPAVGPYDMFVITDTTAAQAQQTAGAGGAAPVTCNQTASVISMQFAPSYSSFTDAQRRDTFAAYAIAVFAMEASVPPSKVDQDCMCYAAAECMTFSSACTIGGAGTT